MSTQDYSHDPATSSEAVTAQSVIPLVAEQIEVDKRVVVTGAVRLRKQTEERTETIEVPLTSVQWRVEHVPVNRVIAEQPTIRLEGETTVYPVVEERVTILKELVLVEEVRVTRASVTTTEVSTHTLKREQILEERVAPLTEAPTKNGSDNF